MTTSLLSRRLFSGRIRLASPSLRLFSTSPGPDTFSSPDHNTFSSPGHDTFSSPGHDTFSSPNHDTFTSPNQNSSRETPAFEPRLLEGGMDPGIFRAILVGKVGQPPVRRQLRSGKDIVFFSLGTGGIRNNRRPFPHERPEEYNARCAVQWHRVSVYVDWLVPVAMRIVKPGAVLYLEGNIETKVFADPASGLVRHIREIAIRGGGRLLYLGSDKEGPMVDSATVRGVGYF